MRERSLAQQIQAFTQRLNYTHGGSQVCSNPEASTCPGFHHPSCLHPRAGPARLTSECLLVIGPWLCSLRPIQTDCPSEWIVQDSLEPRDLKMILSITVLCLRSEAMES